MKQYIVDAFTDKVFSGNPAAICILDEWLSDEIMLSIARENNLSETAFAIKQETKDSINAIHLNYDGLRQEERLIFVDTLLLPVPS